MLDRLFSSKARVAVLGNLLLNPERAYHARELERIVGPGSYHSVWKELKNAERLGIAVSNRLGRMVRYQMNPASQLAADLAPVFRRASEAPAVAETASPTYVAEPAVQRAAGPKVEGSRVDTCPSGLDALPDFEGRATLTAKREEILRAASRHGASNVRIFGSFARGDADPRSDVDFLVDLDPGRSLLDLGGLQVELERIVGRPVDVATEAGLRGRIHDRVLNEAIPL